MTISKLGEKKLLHKNWENVLKIPKTEKLLHHYTSLEVLWKCLENDTMYARNVRFSNDAEEYDFGKTIIHKFCNQKKMGVLENSQCFMICFCLEDDLLSQWRGYASEGISIGFDFSYGLTERGNVEYVSTYHYLNVLNNQHYRQEEKRILEQVIDHVEESSDSDINNEKKNLNNEEKNLNIEEQIKYTVNSEYHGVVTSPYQVSYAEEDETMEELNKIYKKYEEKWGMKEALYEFIPYIKNKGFLEEQECRLLITLNDLMKGDLPHKERLWAKKVFFLQGKKGEKLPNIEVSFGEEEKKRNPCKYVIIENEVCLKYSDFVQELRTELAKMNIELQYNKEKKDSKQIIVGIGKNQPEISLQIEILLEKHHINWHETELKIWYQGHLPIRTITVAPGPDMQRIKESIQYYLKTIYWLKYVEVKESKIPFRT